MSNIEKVKDNPPENIYQKLAKARRYIKENSIEKKGWNSYGKYKYYEPEQIENLVFQACDPLGLITIFNLVEKQTGIIEKITKIFKPIIPDPKDKGKNQKGEPVNLVKKEVHKAKTEIRGSLKVIDIETEKFLEFEMPTKIPEITATNEAQKLGGTVTICKRQLKTTAFGIAENGLDPDTTENTEEREGIKQGYKKEPPVKKQEKEGDVNFADLENHNKTYDPNQYQTEAEKQGKPANLFPEAEKDSNNETEAHKKIRKFMLENPTICGETNEIKQDWLQDFTKFVDKKTGQEKNGVRLIKRLSPKWAGKVWGDIKREFEYILQGNEV
jgi:hypothetical protein